MQHQGLYSVSPASVRTRKERSNVQKFVMQTIPENGLERLAAEKDQKSNLFFKQFQDAKFILIENSQKLSLQANENLLLDFMTNIQVQLPCIDIQSINYHMQNQDFQQLIMTGSCQEFQKDMTKEEYMLKNKVYMNYASRVKLDVHNMKTDFLAGCVFRYHQVKDFRYVDEYGFVELIYFVVNPKMVKKGLGTILMNKLVQTIKSNEKRIKVTKILTFADNLASEFFKKQGYKKMNAIDSFNVREYIEIYSRASLVQLEFEKLRCQDSSNEKVTRFSLKKKQLENERQETDSTKSENGSVFGIVDKKDYILDLTPEKVDDQIVEANSGQKPTRNLNAVEQIVFAKNPNIVEKSIQREKLSDQSNVQVSQIDQNQQVEQDFGYVQTPKTQNNTIQATFLSPKVKKGRKSNSDEKGSKKKQKIFKIKRGGVNQSISSLKINSQSSQTSTRSSNRLQQSESKNCPLKKYKIQRSKNYQHRTLKDVMELVQAWDKNLQIFKTENKENKCNLSIIHFKLHQKMGISKRTYQDFKALLNQGKKYGFEFDKHLHFQLKPLRIFVKKQKNKLKAAAKKSQENKQKCESNQSLRV